MLTYPTLTTGAMSQFPLRKQRRLRTIVNSLDDGTTIKLDDPGAGITEWELNYAGLTDAELATLQQFFQDAEGSLQGFTFLDPAGNLLAWSDHLENPAWDLDPFLSKTDGVADPAGGNNAWHLTNSGAAAQSITQTLSAPGVYLYSFSAYVRTPEASVVTALIGTSRAQRALAAGWSRIFFSASGDPAAFSMSFGLELPAGAAVDIYGMQVEPQSAPSAYKASGPSGVNENAHLRDDALRFTTTGVNCHSATVNIIHASHL